VQAAVFFFVGGAGYYNFVFFALDLHIGVKGIA
jgi:hypothetical protein